MSRSRPPSLLPVVSDRPSDADPADGDGDPVAGAPDPAVVQTTWARVLMESLRRAGVTRAVISPGSRSTPFTLAAAHAGLLTETIIDERSAGFFALGYARATGEPALLICTSGSAGAHYHPAVIEAAHARVPLLVLTADRPPELHGCGAPQTIDQTRLFGTHVRQFVDLGLADASRASLRALCRRAAQAVHATRAPVPGPVHINAGARKPLEPKVPGGAADIAVVERAENILRSFQPQATGATALAPNETIAALARACTAADHGLIIAGPAPLGAGPRSQIERQHAAIWEFARATGYPLLTEAASQLRFADPPTSLDDQPPLSRLDAFDLLVSDPIVARAMQPDLIVQLGPSPISGAWGRYLAQHLDCIHCVLAPHGWNDAHNSADLLVLADVAHTLRRVTQALEPAVHARPARRAWTSSWSHANQLAWRAVDEVVASTVLDTEPTRDTDATDDIGDEGAHIASPPPLMREGQAIAAAVSALPTPSRLLLGNSLPVRTIDTYAPQTATTAFVLSQRGANGIDGYLSAAAGTAWLDGAAYASRPSQPTVAIIGDVCFVHDIGGLAAAARTRAPLCIVVIDNDGGRIFDHLPIARPASGTPRGLYAAHFLTRPGCNLHAAAATFGVGYRQVLDTDALTQAIGEACSEGECTVIHALVEPESSSADRARIQAGLRRWLARDWRAPGQESGE